MANDSMGNLEKLGILVIVILVVVVGVVAITPSTTLFQPEPEPRDLDVDLADFDGDESDGQRPADAGDSRTDLTHGTGLSASPSDVASGASDDPWPVWRPTERGTGGNGGAASGTTGAPLPPVLTDPAAATPVEPVTPQPIRPPVVHTTPPRPVVFVPPTPTPTVRQTEYVVRSGDSLAKIASRQNPPLRWVDIYRANPGMDPNVIRPGQILKIPVAAARAAEAVVRRERGAAAAPVDRRAPADVGGATHVVRKGETLSDIAQRRLGKAVRWRRIYEANRDVISDPDRVPAGIRLRIPSATSSGSSSTGSRAEISSNAAALPRFAEVTAFGGQNYKVERGDNLSRIAARFLGDSSRWPEVFEANRDRMSDPSRLRAGMTIKIP